jgi:hypothetical protein
MLHGGLVATGLSPGPDTVLGATTIAMGVKRALNDVFFGSLSNEFVERAAVGTGVAVAGVGKATLKGVLSNTYFQKFNHDLTEDKVAKNPHRKDAYERNSQIGSVGQSFASVIGNIFDVSGCETAGNIYAGTVGASGAITYHAYKYGSGFYGWLVPRRRRRPAKEDECSEALKSLKAG